MALSTTFMQCAPETIKFRKWRKIKVISPFKVIQGHRFWYQSKALYTTSYEDGINASTAH